MKRLLLPLLLLAAVGCSTEVVPHGGNRGANALGVMTSDGTLLTMGDPADGDCLVRSGTTVDGTPCRTKVDIQTLGADATSITFSGLSGSYMYVVQCNASLAASGTATIGLNAAGSLTTYYVSYFLRDSTSFAGGDLSAAPWYFLPQNWGAADVVSATAIIRAKTGRQRSYHGEVFSMKADRSVSRQTFYDGILSDTSTAITSVVITSGTASGLLSGTSCTLWKEAI